MSRRYGLQPQTLPVERFSRRHNAHIEKCSESGFTVGDEPHAALERVLPKGRGQRCVQIQARQLALGIELALESDMFQATDVIRVQVTDVNIRDVAIREATTCQRPADV